MSRYASSKLYDQNVSNYIKDNVFDLGEMNGNYYGHLPGDGSVHWRFRNGHIEYFKCSSEKISHQVVNPTGILKDTLLFLMNK